MDTQPPVILLIYANDRVDPAHHLRNLSVEVGRIRDALQSAVQHRLCEVVIEANADADRIFSVFQDARYRNRIAVLHYAGHADEGRLLLESAAGGSPSGPSGQGTVHAAGLAAFLGGQRGLELVFLNGCSTAPQVQGLLDANCPAVIATAQAIDDQVAMEFATLFYRGLGGGAGLESAFNDAVAATRTTHGDSPRGLYWGAVTDSPPLAERWPWEIHIRPGAEPARHWNLPEAAGDPLFGLPALPHLDLPESPFRHLSWFDREHAEVFFGRAFQVRELFDRITAPDAPPILLFYGQSGVGKSSVLAAGLLPRLEINHRVHYLRRDPVLGLFGTLIQPLGAGGDEPLTAWRQAETDASVPLLLILDQVEEVFTRPAADPGKELGTLLAGLQAIFGQPDRRPRGRLILSFRKEWLPEIETRLADQRLPCGRLFLQGLDRRGIIAAVEGPTRGDRLRNAYGLQIDAGLAEEIADDLLADPDSPIAPTLQILVTKLWQAARDQDYSAPCFTRDLYLKLKRDGILLKDFLDQQLAALEQWRPEVVRSGLALDLLAAHTTPTGTADQCTEEELSTAYTQVQETLPALLQRCKDGYLLTDIPSTGRDPVKGTRLAHDTLAPLVRARFEESDRPGQRARRVLESRVIGWRDGATGDLLDAADLRIVEDGVNGMRACSRDEMRLVSLSRIEAKRLQNEAERVVRELEQAQRNAELRRMDAERQARTAIARLQASQAAAAAERHPIRALLLAAESVRRPLDADGTRLGGSETVLRELIGATGGRPLGEACALGFDPQGRWLATGRDDQTVRLWDLEHLESKPRVLPAHGGVIEAVAFDPQGRWLATGGGEQTARLWDLRSITSESRLSLKHAGTIEFLAFDPGGRWLAIASRAGTASLLDLKAREGEPRVLPEQQGGIHVLAFDPKGRWFAIGAEDGTTRLWDLRRPKAAPRVLRGHTGAIWTVAFDPQGRWLATGGKEETARLWDLSHPDVDCVLLQGHRGWIESLAFDPQGPRLATGSWDGTVRIWDLQHPEIAPQVLGEQQPAILKQPNVIRIIAFYPQGRWLATGGTDHTARLWDLQHPAQGPWLMRGHDDAIQSLAFDSQGRWLATLSLDKTARLWDLQGLDAEPQVLRGHDDSIWIRAFAFDPQGRRLATGSKDGTVRLWDLQSSPGTEPQVLHGHEGGAPALAFDHQAGWLATGSKGGGLYLWDQHKPAAEPRVLSEHGSCIAALAFDRADRWLAAGRSDGTAWLWELDAVEAGPRVLGGHEGEIRTLAFDPQGRWLATAGTDAVTRLWGLQDPTVPPRELRGHTDSILALAFDFAGRWLATVSSDDTARLWDLMDVDVDVVCWVLPGHERGAWALAFDPQGRWLATGGGDMAARLWDLRDAQAEPRVLRGHGGSVIFAVAFDPLGHWLATGSDDQTARLWDLEHPGSEPRVLRGHTAAVWSLAFDPQGRWLATGSEDYTARLWQLNIGVLLDRACRIAGRNLSADEWREHCGDTPYQVTCPEFPSAEASDGKAEPDRH